MVFLACAYDPHQSLLQVFHTCIEYHSVLCWPLPLVRNKSSSTTGLHTFLCKCMVIGCKILQNTSIFVSTKENGRGLRKDPPKPKENSTLVGMYAIYLK